MMPKPPAPDVTCPTCGRLNPATDSTCFACHKRLAIFIGPAPVLPRSYGLGSLMSLVAAVAVGLVPSQLEPWLCLPTLFVLVPAVIRMITVASQKHEDRLPFSWASYLTVFISSLGVMCGILAAGLFVAGFSFFALAPVAQSSQRGLIAALGASGVFGACFAGAILIKCWRYKG